MGSPVRVTHADNSFLEICVNCIMSCTPCQRARLQRIVTILKAKKSKEDEKGQWITVDNGEHVFIPHGADKGKTIKEHFASREDKSIVGNPDKGIDLTNKKLKIDTQYYNVEDPQFAMLPSGKYASGAEDHSTLFNMLDPKKRWSYDLMHEKNIIRMAKADMEIHIEITSKITPEQERQITAILKDSESTMGGAFGEINHRSLSRVFTNRRGFQKALREFNAKLEKGKALAGAKTEEEGDWITVKGSAVFIPKGADKGQAIKDHFAKSKKNKPDKTPKPKTDEYGLPPKPQFDKNDQKNIRDLMMKDEVEFKDLDVLLRQGYKSMFMLDDGTPIIADGSHDFYSQKIMADTETFHNMDKKTLREYLGRENDSDSEHLSIGANLVRIMAYRENITAEITGELTSSQFSSLKDMFGHLSPQNILIDTNIGNLGAYAEKLNRFFGKYASLNATKKPSKLLQARAQIVLQYAKALLSAKEKPERWITVKGAKVPIFKGETNEQATKNFLSKKDKEPKKTRAERQADSLAKLKSDPYWDLAEFEDFSVHTTPDEFKKMNDVAQNRWEIWNEKFGDEIHVALRPPAKTYTISPDHKKMMTDKFRISKHVKLRIGDKIYTNMDTETVDDYLNTASDTINSMLSPALRAEIKELAIDDLKGETKNWGSWFSNKGILQVNLQAMGSKAMLIRTITHEMGHALYGLFSYEVQKEWGDTSLKLDPINPYTAKFHAEAQADYKAWQEAKADFAQSPDDYGKNQKEFSAKIKFQSSIHLYANELQTAIRVSKLKMRTGTGWNDDAYKVALKEFDRVIAPHDSITKGLNAATKKARTVTVLLDKDMMPTKTNPKYESLYYFQDSKFTGHAFKMYQGKLTARQIAKAQILLQYARVLQAAKEIIIDGKKVERWITVSGAKVPMFAGQTAEQAAKEFLDKQSKKTSVKYSKPLTKSVETEFQKQVEKTRKPARDIPMVWHKAMKEASAGTDGAYTDFTDQDDAIYKQLADVYDYEAWDGDPAVDTSRPTRALDELENAILLDSKSVDQYETDMEYIQEWAPMSYESYSRINEMRESVNEAIPEMVKKYNTIYRKTNLSNLQNVLEGGTFGYGRQSQNYGKKHDFVSTTVSRDAAYSFDGNVLVEFDTTDMKEKKDWRGVDYQMRFDAFFKNRDGRYYRYDERYNGSHPAAFSHEMEVRIRPGTPAKIRRVRMNLEESDEDATKSIVKYLKSKNIEVVHDGDIDDTINQDDAIDDTKPLSATDNIMRYMLSQLRQLHAIEHYRKDGDLYVKTFLVDETRNKNGWRASWASIKKNVKTFHKRPGIEYYKCTVHGCNMDHTEGDTLKEAVHAQEPHRVSTIMDTVLDEPTHTAYAIHKIHNEDFAKKIEQGVVKYLSPSIWPNKEKTTMALSDDDEWHIDTTDWTGLHDAWVDNPAFGHKARVVGQCRGDKSCITELKTNRMLVATQLLYKAKALLAEQQTLQHNPKEEKGKWITARGTPVFIPDNVNRRDFLKKHFDMLNKRDKKQTNIKKYGFKNPVEQKDWDKETTYTQHMKSYYGEKYEKDIGELSYFANFFDEDSVGHYEFDIPEKYFDDFNLYYTGDKMEDTAHFMSEMADRLKQSAYTRDDYDNFSEMWDIAVKHGTEGFEQELKRAQKNVDKLNKAHEKIFEEANEFYRATTFEELDSYLENGEFGHEDSNYNYSAITLSKKLALNWQMKGVDPDVNVVYHADKLRPYARLVPYQLKPQRPGLSHSVDSDDEDSLEQAMFVGYALESEARVPDEVPTKDMIKGIYIKGTWHEFDQDALTEVKRKYSKLGKIKVQYEDWGKDESLKARAQAVLQYAKALLAVTKEEDGNWITVKGSAVFIPTGKDKGQAIKDHFAKSDKGSDNNKESSPNKNNFNKKNFDIPIIDNDHIYDYTEYDDILANEVSWYYYNTRLEEREIALPKGDKYIEEIMADPQEKYDLMMKHAEEETRDWIQREKIEKAERMLYISKKWPEIKKHVKDYNDWMQSKIDNNDPVYRILNKAEMTDILKTGKFTKVGDMSKGEHKLNNKSFTFDKGHDGTVNAEYMIEIPAKDMDFKVLKAVPYPRLQSQKTMKWGQPIITMAQQELRLNIDEKPQLPKSAKIYYDGKLITADQTKSLKARIVLQFAKALHAATKDKGRWITVKGTAVFIPQGHDTGDAIKSHFDKGKRTFDKNGFDNTDTRIGVHVNNDRLHKARLQRLHDKYNAFSESEKKTNKDWYEYELGQLSRSLIGPVREYWNSVDPKRRMFVKNLLIKADRTTTMGGTHNTLTSTITLNMRSKPEAIVGYLEHEISHSIFEKYPKKKQQEWDKRIKAVPEPYISDYASSFGPGGARDNTDKVKEVLRHINLASMGRESSFNLLDQYNEHHGFTREDYTNGKVAEWAKKWEYGMKMLHANEVHSEFMRIKHVDKKEQKDIGPYFKEMEKIYDEVFGDV